MSSKKTKKEHEQKAQVIDTYDKSEFIKASMHLFGVPSECAVAALRKIENPISLDEATKIIDEFMNMEVK